MYSQTFAQTFSAGISGIASRRRMMRPLLFRCDYHAYPMIVSRREEGACCVQGIHPSVCVTGAIDREWPWRHAVPFNCQNTIPCHPGIPSITSVVESSALASSSVTYIIVRFNFSSNVGHTYSFCLTVVFFFLRLAHQFLYWLFGIRYLNLMSTLFVQRLRVLLI